MEKFPFKVKTVSRHHHYSLRANLEVADEGLASDVAWRVTLSALQDPKCRSTCSITRKPESGRLDSGDPAQ